jgi:prepilin-type processing-associated H-X9-DG protein
LERKLAHISIALNALRGHARRQAADSTSSGKAAFTVLELLISMSVIAMLAGLLLPAVQAAREAARRAECTHSLRQIGMALQGRHDAQGRFPAGWKSVRGTRSAMGWASSLLPYLEQHTLHLSVDDRAAINAPSNSTACATTLPLMLCASDVQEQRFALFKEIGDHELSGQASVETLVELPAANYIGVFGSSDPDAELAKRGEGPFIGNRELTMTDLRRSSSHVLFVGERTARKLPSTWLGIDLQGEDATGRVTGQAWLGPNRPDADECEFDSRHPGGVNFLWGDSHVAWVVDEIDPGLYRQLASLEE